MSIIKGLEAGVVKMLLELNTVNAKEAAVLVGNALDGALDARYGGKASEEIQDKVILAVELFCTTLTATLKADRKTIAPIPGIEVKKEEAPAPIVVKNKSPEPVKSNIHPKKKGR